jgi:hypothetical protein
MFKLAATPATDATTTATSTSNNKTKKTTPESNASKSNAQQMYVEHDNSSIRNNCMN